MWHRKGASGRERQETAREGALGDSGSAARVVEAGAGEIEGRGQPAVSESAPMAAEPGALPSAWRMGLVVSASALCGGIAVVLWNRRLLTKMREVVPVKREEYRAKQGRLWEDDT